MALGKLVTALLIARVICLSACGFALVMYIANGNIIYDTNAGLSLAATLVQLVVSTAELMLPSCLEVADLLPNNMKWSLIIIATDALAALFMIITGFGGIGVYIFRKNLHVCPDKCGVSFIYSIIVAIGGISGGFVVLLSLIVAAKMNIERHQAQH